MFVINTREEFLNLFTPLKMRIARFAWHNGSCLSCYVKDEIYRRTGLWIDETQWAYDFGCFIWGSTNWREHDYPRVPWDEITEAECNNDGSIVVMRYPGVGMTVINAKAVASINFT